MDGALLAELFNQFPGFLFRQEPAGLDCVDEQFQLRQLEVSGCDVVSAVLAGDRNDIHAVLLEGGDVGVDGFPLTGDAIAVFQHFNQLGCPDGMVSVGVLLQIVEDIKDFQLLIVGFRHKITSWEQYSISCLNLQFLR